MIADLFPHFVLGVIQGITEFLPISSSGHLILFPQIFHLDDQGLAVDAALHLATALAIFFYFRNDWWTILKNWKKKNSMFKKIVVASIPAALMGILLNDLVESVFRSPMVVVVMLVSVAGVMWWVERNYTEVRKIPNDGTGAKNVSPFHIEWLPAIIIGLIQVVALIPGTSRSGITITAGMWQTLPREQAAKFSFLLGMPITLGAGLVKLPDLLSSPANDLYLAGFAAVVAFVVALLTMWWLLGFFRKGTLLPFVWYRLILAGLVMWLVLGG